MSAQLWLGLLGIVQVVAGLVLAIWLAKLNIAAALRAMADVIEAEHGGTW